MGSARITEAPLRLLACAGMLLITAGCTVVPVQEVARAKAGDRGAFSVASFIAEVWPGRVTQELRARAIPLEDLRKGVDEVGPRHGNRAGEGSPWTLVLRGDGIVRAIDGDSPRGRLQVDTAIGPVMIQTGPVVSGSTIRDALPFIAFDHFPDQISFAEAAMALTDKALVRLRPALATVNVGDRVSFLGTASATADQSAVVLTPVELAVRGADGAPR